MIVIIDNHSMWSIILMRFSQLKWWKIQPLVLNSPLSFVSGSVCCHSIFACFYIVPLIQSNSSITIQQYFLWHFKILKAGQYVFLFTFVPSWHLHGLVALTISHLSHLMKMLNGVFFLLICHCSYCLCQHPFLFHLMMEWIQMAPWLTEYVHLNLTLTNTSHNL